jgi:branched-subunit amino acid aminotransferase/4-amino-4-deoxychorismate lyase
VTRAIVLDLVPQLDLNVRQESLSPEILRSADEMFITNSIMEIMPVRMLEGRPVGTGRPGPVCRRILDAYRTLVRQECCR